MSKNDFILAAVKGEPNSLTSIAFHTGEIIEKQRIIKLLEADCKDGLGDQIQGCSHEVAIALIKGENKTSHNGAEHTICCNDWGCYGCEDCDCEDCLEEENK